jgi:hypothetical protein
MDDLLLSEVDRNEKEKEILEHSANLAKKAFINEIKYGLGEQIKKNPNTLTVPKISRWERFKKRMIKLFIKF